MPIMLNGRTGTFVLYCLNGHRDEGHPDGTTMVAVEDWLSVPTAPVPGMPRPVHQGLVLRCYYCSVCGYTELYMPKQRAVPGGFG